MSLYMKFTGKSLPFKFDYKLYLVYNKDNINEKEGIHNAHSAQYQFCLFVQPEIS